MTEMISIIRTQKSKAAIPVFLILLLLMINGILLYKNQAIKQDRKEVLEVIQEEKIELRAEYDEMIVELENYQVQNAKLDTHVLSLQNQIDIQRLEIERLLQTTPTDPKAVLAARALVASFKEKVANYKQKTTAFRKKNQVLSTSNKTLQKEVSTNNSIIEVLKTEKKQLVTEKEKLIETKDSLIEESVLLVEEKQELIEETAVLTKKVNKASILKATKITGIGVWYRKNGREQESPNIRRAEKIKVCFDLLENAITKIGHQEVLVRIINPKGSTLSIQSLGSGYFKNAVTKEDMPYTLKEVIGYDGEQANYCFYWEQNTPFTSGMYTAQIYHKEHLIGSSYFNLRKGL